MGAILDSLGFDQNNRGYYQGYKVDQANYSFKIII